VLPSGTSLKTIVQAVADGAGVLLLVAVGLRVAVPVGTVVAVGAMLVSVGVFVRVGRVAVGLAAVVALATALDVALGVALGVAVARLTTPMRPQISLPPLFSVHVQKME
jgi:hypothetical protein